MNSNKPEGLDNDTIILSNRSINQKGFYSYYVIFSTTDCNVSKFWSLCKPEIEKLNVCEEENIVKHDLKIRRMQYKEFDHINLA